jgi:hypothetical protein
MDRPAGSTPFRVSPASARCCARCVSCSAFVVVPHDSRFTVSTVHHYGSAGRSNAAFAAASVFWGAEGKEGDERPRENSHGGPYAMDDRINAVLDEGEPRVCLASQTLEILPKVNGLARLVASVPSVCRPLVPPIVAGVLRASQSSCAEHRHLRRLCQTCSVESTCMGTLTQVGIRGRCCPSAPSDGSLPHVLSDGD